MTSPRTDTVDPGQSDVDLWRYLGWQTGRIDRDPLYFERLYVGQHAEIRAGAEREPQMRGLGAMSPVGSMGNAAGQGANSPQAESFLHDRILN